MKKLAVRSPLASIAARVALERGGVFLQINELDTDALVVMAHDSGAMIRHHDLAADGRALTRALRVAAFGLAAPGWLDSCTWIAANHAGR